MKSGTILSIIILATAAVVVLTMAKPDISGFFEQKEKVSGQWRYKMTVTVATPEGDVWGSAVREMGNATPRIDLPDVGNPADVRGEAVVVDLRERGVLFALISHASDLEFYNAFPVPGNPRGVGGSSSMGIKYYSNLPVGTKAELPSDFPPAYPKLVTFTDMSDPKSVALAQVWERSEDGTYFLAKDHMEEIFGDGVKLKSIVLEITDETTTRGEVDKYLTDNFWEKYGIWMKSLNISERGTTLSFSKGQFEQGKTK